MGFFLMRPFTLGLLYTVLVLAPVEGWSQSFTGSILGDVADSSGAAIPNVSIVAINLATNQRTEARSDGTGRYSVSPLQPGTYSLEASVAGFKKFVQKGIELAVGQQARVEIA